MKFITAIAAVAAIAAKVSADDCFSLKLGYKCCKGNEVVTSDEHGLWGIEDNEWCGIGNGYLKKRQWWGNWGQNNQGGNPWEQNNNNQQWAANPWEQNNNQGGNPWEQNNNQWGQNFNQGNQGGNPWEQNNNQWGQNNNQGGNPWEQNNNQWGQNNNQGGNPWEQNNNQGGNQWGQNNNQGGNPWEQNNNQGGNQWDQNNNNQQAPAPEANTPVTNTDAPGNTAPETTAPNTQAQNNAPTGGGSSSYPYPLKNSPVPSKGCGKNPTLKGQFDFTWSGGSRMVLIDIPENYDNSKPYRLVFGMQCMGGSAENVRSEGYYGLKPLDTGKTTIFVAPQGNGQQLPWGEADYKLFDELLEKLKGDLCIDESRVFSTGFSYGSMFSNGLSWNHQKVLRGVAVYETAERNIYLPEHTGDGIGWMGVLGFDDGLCTPEMGRNARDIVLKHNSDGGKAVQEKAEEAQPNGPHKCYDYTTVDEKFPVRWCTQSGGHLWDHKDPGSNQSWVPQATWEFINKF